MKDLQTETTDCIFIKLIRVALGNEKLSHYCMTDETYFRVMNMARQQGVEALIGDALIQQKVLLSRSCVEHLMTVMRLTSLRNERVNRGITEMTLEMSKKGICSMVIKGQIVALLYPNPSARTPGDVDLYILTKGKRVGEMARQLAESSEWVYGDRKHVGMTIKGVTYEWHRQLLLFASNSHRRYWNKLIKEVEDSMEQVVVNEFKINTLPLRMHTMYVLLHLFFHLITSGVGIRQWCDLAVMIDHMDEEERQWMGDVMKKMGFTRAFRVAMVFCNDYLGTDIKGMTGHASDHWWARKIYQRVIHNGNFGNAQRRCITKGIFHRLETCCLTLKNVCSFWPLAPLETLLRIPLLIMNL